jgi:hypothetical protein
MKVELWALERIIPYARNPRNNEEAVAGVAASIKEFGPRQCIVVDKDGVIIAGHTRLKAAQRLGMAEFPVHVAEGLTKTQIKAYRLADNKVAEKATWNVEMLKVELDDLAGMDFDMDVMGFDPEESGLFEAQETPTPHLADGDRAPFRQMTFTLHDEPFDEVEAAIKKAKEEGGSESSVNENSNGNALSWICGVFNRG